MDGTATTILHDIGLSQPYCITLDFDTQTLYWADYALNKIEKSNADGSNRQQVTTSLVTDAYSMTFLNGNLYWTDLAFSRILTFPLSSTTSAYLTAAFGSMYGITAITEERQPNGNVHTNNASHFHFVIIVVRNPCRGNPGNCSHFCLLSSTTTTRYQCGCPDGMMLVNASTCGRESDQMIPKKLVYYNSFTFLLQHLHISYLADTQILSSVCS